MNKLLVWLSALLFIGFTSMALAKSAATVDVNSADAATLAKTMVGVGKAKADAIVKYRAEHGAFTSIDDLAKVTGAGGITKKIIDDNRATVTCGSSAPASAAPAKPAAAPAAAPAAKAPTPAAAAPK